MRFASYKWPEDADFEENEGCIWSVLKPEDFNEQVHLGWRYSADSIARLARGEKPQRAAKEQTDKTASPVHRWTV